MIKANELARLSGALFELYLPLPKNHDSEKQEHFSGYVMSTDQLEKFAELVILAHKNNLLG